MRRPNLFHFATRELSQDAILAWLASWAAPEARSQDPSLHDLGIDFLRSLLAKHRRTLPAVESVEVKRQYRNIDVLVIVNHSLVLVIEDKVYAKDAVEKLRRYVTQLRDEGYRDEQLLPTFVQTGDQGSYHAVAQAGYALVRRSDLISVLQSADAKGVANDIVRDFLEHLLGIEEKVRAFAALPLTGWDRYAWTGFYQQLQVSLSAGEWDYVANPGGGFLGFWWNFVACDCGSRYLQLEEERLCFKISIDEPQERPPLVRKWSQAVISAGEALGVPVVRPSRVQPAQTTTVALIRDGYRVPLKAGNLDLSGTLEILRAAERVMAHALSAG